VLGWADLARGLGPGGAPIPAYRTFSVEVRSAQAGAAVARLSAGPHLASAGGGLLPGALAIVADTCCGSAVTAHPANGTSL
jgi:acyl-coenzyme A thioesterase PaaI-like protein